VPDQFRDLHASIADVSQHYHFQEMPGMVTNLQEWFTNFARWLADLLARLFSLTPIASDTRAFGDAIKHLWYVVGFLCALGLLYVVVRRTWEVLSKASAAQAGVQSASKILDSADWMKEANQLADQGDWRFACRALYMACLRMLDEAGVLAFGASRTNYEYWYALQKEKEIQMRFRELADVIDQSWFGNRDVGRPDFRKCSELLKEIAQEIANRSVRLAKA
jgi:hypothetical protein